MNDFRPWRSTRPNPWPRRIAIVLLIAFAVLVLYVFGAQAAGKPPVDTAKPWPPVTLRRHYACRYQYRLSPPAYCTGNR